MIGYTSERGYTFIDAEQTWAEATAKLALQVSDRLEKSGRHVLIGGLNNELCFDRKTRALFRVARSCPEEGRLTQWRIPRVDRRLRNGSSPSA
jgi:hypothetical protein